MPAPSRARANLNTQQTHTFDRKRREVMGIPRRIIYTKWIDYQ